MIYYTDIYSRYHKFVSLCLEYLLNGGKSAQIILLLKIKGRNTTKVIVIIIPKAEFYFHKITTYDMI